MSKKNKWSPKKDHIEKGRQTEKESRLIKGACLVYDIFLTALLCLLPLFFWEGYTLIATRKSEMFLWICRISFAVLLPLMIALFFWCRKNKKPIHFSKMDFFVIMFLAANTTSFLLSGMRMEAWTGFPGWKMGFRITLYCVGIYFLTSRLFQRSRFFISLAMVSSALIFLWGSANSLGYRVIEMPLAWDNFIGPIGNTNWFAGYFSVFFPMGTVVLFLAEGNFLRLFGLIYTAVGVFTALVIGSDSAYISLFVAAGAAWYLTFRFCFHEGRGKRWLRYILPGVFLVAAALLILLIAVNTAYPGAIGFLSGKSFFTFDYNWGTFRGRNYRAATMTYENLPWFRKLFGTGQDCFPYVVYAVPGAKELLEEFYGATVLANAHNECLTALINIGAVGTILFYGVTIYEVISVLRMKERSLPALAAAVCIVSYLMHNMVSFAQVLNYPYLFLWMGIAEKCRRMQVEPVYAAGL